MTLIPFFLLAIGLILVFLEFFLPGGIMAISAGILLLASVIFFAIEFSSFLATMLYSICVVGIVCVLIKFTLKRFKKGKFKGIFLNSAQNGYVASQFAKEMIGKQGEAVSDLKPAGHILVAGKRYQALSKMGYIDKGSSIEVIGGEGAHLIVKSLSTKTDDSDSSFTQIL